MRMVLFFFKDLGQCMLPPLLAVQFGHSCDANMDFPVMAGGFFSLLAVC